MNLFRRFMERRSTHVEPDDRRKPTMKESQDRLNSAIEDLERTVIGRKPVCANDIQVTVKFETFAEICEFRYKNGSVNAICKHKEHEAHGTFQATCNEQQCPFMTGKVK